MKDGAGALLNDPSEFLLLYVKIPRNQTAYSAAVSAAQICSDPARRLCVMLLITLCAVAVAAFVLRSIRRRGGEPTGMAGGLTGLSG